MTDRERLLEQVKKAETRAKGRGLVARMWMTEWGSKAEVDRVADIAARKAREAAHHALTALALREVLEYHDRTGWAWGSE